MRNEKYAILPLVVAKRQNCCTVQPWTHELGYGADTMFHRMFFLSFLHLVDMYIGVHVKIYCQYCMCWQTFLIQLKQKLRAPRHPLSDHMTDDGYEVADDVDRMIDDIDEDYLTRDEFNLHKIIVAVTMPGKVLKLSYDRLILNEMW